MAEVQAHGNSFEDMIIRERTGLSKEEYDKLKENGYTSTYDLCNGLIVDYDGSIKTTGSKVICCSDILRMMSHQEYRIIVGCYDQVANQKVFHTQYEFNIRPKDYHTLWGDMKYEDVKNYVNKVKTVQKGKEGQQQYQLVAESWKSEVQSDKSMFMINPKVDSKNQRRVQCSIKLDDLIQSGVEYTKKDLNIVITSSRRTFNK
jgi:hypothetical protein